MDFFGPLTPALLIPMIIGLVELIKQLGVSGKGTLIASMVIGIAFGAAFELKSMFPAIEPWLQVIVVGILFGLSASGIYKFSQKFMTEKVVYLDVEGEVEEYSEDVK